MRGDQGAKVAGVFCHEHEIVFGAALQHFVIRRAQAAKVARVHSDVDSFGVQHSGDGGREALVEKQPHGVAATEFQVA